MSGMRRVDGLYKSKSKYAKNDKEEEEEIDFQQQDLCQETKNIDNNDNKSQNQIDDNSINNENNHFENLEINEKLNNITNKNIEEKKEEEILINQNELVNALKELEDATSSSKDDSQISINGDREKNQIILKNIDSSTSIEDIEEFFRKCGEIRRVSIMFNKYTQQPKGCALIQFNTNTGRIKALELNKSLFKGKQIIVTEKTSKIPNYISSKNKNMNYHAYLNDDSNKNKFEQDAHAAPSSIGPIKARLVARKSFEPY